MIGEKGAGNGNDNSILHLYSFPDLTELKTGGIYFNPVNKKYYY